MVFHENVSSSLAVETPTLVQQTNEGLSERILNLMSELAEVLLQNAKQGDQVIALRMASFVTFISFNKNNFKQYGRILADCINDSLEKRFITDSRI